MNQVNKGLVVFAASGCMLKTQMRCEVLQKTQIRGVSFDFLWSGRHVRDSLRHFLFFFFPALRQGKVTDSGKNEPSYILNKTWGVLDSSYLVRRHVHFVKLFQSQACKCGKYIKHASLVWICSTFA